MQTDGSEGVLNIGWMLEHIVEVGDLFHTGKENNSNKIFSE